MVKTCCAPNCRNKSKKPGISFFCFPKSPVLRQEWVRRVNKSSFQPTRHTVLCSEHFPGDSFLSESVPEFLQLIGLEQRPARRRLKNGALPTLFKLTKNGWEEGLGQEEEGGTVNEKGRGEEDGEDEDPGKEDGLTDESDDDGHFVIQMDVAEEDTMERIVPSEAIKKPVLYANQLTQDEQLTENHRPEPSPCTKIADRDCGDAHDMDSQEEDNCRPDRPRRSCRIRGTRSEQSKREGGEWSPKRKIKKELDDKEDESEKEEDIQDEDGQKQQEESNCYSKEGLSGEEPQLFRIESVRTLNSSDHDKATENVGQVRNSEESPDRTTYNIPPPKKPRKSKADQIEDTHLRFIPANQAGGSRPVLFRIDPAFCKFQPVFEVPFASSPVVFQKSVDMISADSSSKTTEATAICNGSGDNLHHPSKTVTGSVEAAIKCVPSTASLSARSSTDCTLPCCTGKTSSSTSSNKMHVKQEATDKEFPSGLCPGGITEQHLSESNRRSSRHSPRDIPYRSSPVSIPFGSDASKVSTQYCVEPVSVTLGNELKGSSVPYRSEPIMKLPLPSLPTSADKLAEKAKRNLAIELSLARYGHHTPHKQAQGSCTPTPSPSVDAGREGDTGQPSGGQSWANRHGSTVKSPTTPSCNSAAAKKKISVVADNLSSGHLSALLAPPVSSAAAQEPTSNPASGISDGSIFIRRDHILADLLDVFKHSGDSIQRSTVFRLCHNVSATATGNATTPVSSTASSVTSPHSAPVATGAKVESLQDNWEDVQHKRLFSLFWEECMKVHFDGFQQKVPKLGSQRSSCSDVPYVLGKVLRHGFVLCGYWPVALSPACAVSVFTGEKSSQGLFLMSLRRAMFPYEMQALDDLRHSAKEGGMRFQEVRKERMVRMVVETYGGSHCQVPAVPEEVDAFITELAAYYLYCQPFWWLREMRRGFLCLTQHTRQDHAYLTSMTEREVVEMYRTLDPTPQALFHRLTFRFTDDGKQVTHNRLKAYLERCLLRMAHKDLLRLLKLWSHANCLLDENYYVKFSSSLSSGHGATSCFRPSTNTLVLPASSPSFDRFEASFRTLVQEPASDHRLSTS